SMFDVVMTLGFDAIDDYHDISILNPLVPTGLFAGVYTVAEDIFPAGVNYNEILNLWGGEGPVVIDDGFIGTPNQNNAGQRGFDFSDRGTYQVAATPEPASLIVWAGLV